MNVWLGFAALWLVITSLLGLFSGWFILMKKYPDREEAPLLRLKRQSGSMGLGVAMRGILTLSVCPSGLRIGIMRIFGPFSREFFVPRKNISVERQNRLLWRAAELRFGNPAVGRIAIRAPVADRLARSAGTRWPEPGPFPQETHRQVLFSVAKEWAAFTLLATLFFTLAPRLMAPKHAAPPLSVAILFPAVMFGFAALFQYLSRTRAPR